MYTEYGVNEKHDADTNTVSMRVCVCKRERGGGGTIPLPKHTAHGTHEIHIFTGIDESYE